jgi:hypothetical protein
MNNKSLRRACRPGGRLDLIRFHLLRILMVFAIATQIDHASDSECSQVLPSAGRWLPATVDV